MTPVDLYDAVLRECVNVEQCDTGSVDADCVNVEQPCDTG